MKFSFSFLSCFSSSADNLEGSQTTYGGQISQNFSVYCYNDLKAATHGFRASNKIGEGGFGSVYKVKKKILLFSVGFEENGKKGMWVFFFFFFLFCELTVFMFYLGLFLKRVGFKMEPLWL
ncbi:hypothetical protein AABB24_015483 [Solanum stoloniferum]|uniref:Uncharacterized protein n=1 Tax=Solanum stoloniferum TaxID=62892 RepID=A0ABD2TPN5_9SOLN